MTYSLYLAHINDTHSHFESSLVHFYINLHGQRYQIDAQCGGYARIASAVAEQRKIAKQQQIPSLLLHAGDSFQGSLYFSQFKGLANARLLNLLMPDAMTIGNHEFDLGNAPVSQFVDQAEFALLAGNMDLSQEDQHKPQPLAPHKNLYRYDNQQQIAEYLLKPLGDKQLAIIGITHDLMHNIGCPDADCHFLNAIETTQATIKHLQQQGIKHILVLSHLGHSGDLALAEAVSGISLIVGGHSHTLTGDFSEMGIESTQQSQHWHHGCLILQAGKHAESIGLERLEFDSEGKVISVDGGVSFLIDNQWQALQHGQPVSPEIRAQIADYLAASSLVSHYPDDQQMTKIINQEYRPVIDEMRRQVVTTLSKPLLHSRMPTSQLPEGSEISPLVCQGFYQAANAKQPTDFALHNAGGVRVSLKAGPLTKAEICGRLLPFEIAIVSYLVSGKQLLQVIESSIDNATNNGLLGTGDGSFPYFYKLRYHYQGDKPAGKRVSKVELRCGDMWQALELKKNYRGVSSAYTLAGKEGYHALLDSWDHQDLGMTMSDSFVTFASQQKQLV
ncbi:bifunctional metallophosphatase/5'-nucleotidase [Agarivorans sp. Toyoura001]|uniref:bifunctional metallophosphatase/5'-nucleotidase n=1 Tax=Agarivorans sp. Toyoura001 TaxID=2283141 RepID=UPI0010DD350F|nr:bifunctional UDP-sugar hydrolase/5'-nucleotidase [Agarivorans sp. Toyoura001]GDY28062.1 bifunctional metallophosphatase/5'-nucleotidase [Agarivorans sp. Toyoura001]